MQTARTAREVAEGISHHDTQCGNGRQDVFFSDQDRKIHLADLLDDARFSQALAYVERNPLRPGLVDRAEAYRWSSAKAHCGEGDQGCRLDLCEWRARYTGERWSDARRMGLADEAVRERIREPTRRGNPLGNDSFAKGSGTALGRDMHVRPLGRPPKKVDTAGGKMG